MNSPPTSPSSDGSVGAPTRPGCKNAPANAAQESRSFVSEDYLLGMMASSATTGRKVSAGQRVKSPRKINANSYCGRHSDEFLFGPHGFGDLWRSITNKKDQ